MIEVAPLAYMRGRTLNHAFIILDEAQNTTPEQMKMFLTRIGFGSKAVVTGDTTQIDLPRGNKSGLIDAQEVLGDVRGIAVTRFSSVDVVRHPLVARIVEAYDAHSTKRDPDSQLKRCNHEHTEACRTAPETERAVRRSRVPRAPRAVTARRVVALGQDDPVRGCRTHAALCRYRGRPHAEPHVSWPRLRDERADLRCMRRTKPIRSRAISCCAAPWWSRKRASRTNRWLRTMLT